MSPSVRPLFLLALMAAPAGAAVAAEDGAAEDQTLVVARTVEPRVAYRALEPKDNPVRVEATTFPGRTFHAAIDAIAGDGIELAALDELAERVPVGSARGAAGPLPTATLPAALAAPGAGPAAAAGRGGAGASVLRATSQIGPAVLQGVSRALPGGGR